MRKSILMGLMLLGASPVPAHASDGFYFRFPISGPKRIQGQQSSTAPVQPAPTWTAGPWSEWSSSCSPSSSRSRTVSCTVDGTVVPTNRCDSASMPGTVETAERMDGCPTAPKHVYAWNTGGWSQWSSQCSDSASRTRTVSCLDENSSPQDDASCSQPVPERSQTTSIRTGCPTDPSDVANPAPAKSEGQVGASVPPSSPPTAYQDPTKPPSASGACDGRTVALNGSTVAAMPQKVTFWSLGWSGWFLQFSVWRVRNANAVPVTLQLTNGIFSKTLSVPARSDVIAFDLLPAMGGTHKLYLSRGGQWVLVDVKSPVSGSYTAC